MGRRKPRLTAQTLKVLTALITSGSSETSGAQIADSTNLMSGTLYPILIRLEEAGWVESRWETEEPSKLGRPRRRFYRVTGIGEMEARAAAREVLVQLKELAWL